MAQHFTESKSNQGTSVSKTPFLIDNILHQNVSSMKKGIKQNSENISSGNSNNNNNSVNNNNNTNNNENQAIGVNSKTHRNHSIDAPNAAIDEDYRKMLQSER